MKNLMYKKLSKHRVKRINKYIDKKSIKYINLFENITFDRLQIPNIIISSKLIDPSIFQSNLINLKLSHVMINGSRYKIINGTLYVDSSNDYFIPINNNSCSKSIYIDSFTNKFKYSFGVPNAYQGFSDNYNCKPSVNENNLLNENLLNDNLGLDDDDINYDYIFYNRKLLNSKVIDMYLFKYRR